jgi:hypothetical protein
MFPDTQIEVQYLVSPEESISLLNSRLSPDSQELLKFPD